MSTRRILVTSALPYANGPIHLGHLVEYLQTDIWVRFQKLQGHCAIYLCADDTHGTAIMISARKEGIAEEELIARMQKAHLDDFQRFDIEFDNYGSTHSPETRRACEEIWAAIRKAGLVLEKDVTQLYDPVAGTFLADRFVKGTCPDCRAPDQYGDSCERCGHTYSPSDLIDPVSTLSGAKPEVRSARHLFFHLEQMHAFLDEWTQSGDHLQTEVANYLQGHFLGEPLRDWDISRPAPYFGFEIPDSPGNYWYVWFDAPIGYIGSTRQWCQRHGEDFDSWWKAGEGARDEGRGTRDGGLGTRDEGATGSRPSPLAPRPSPEIHHFIGKDITYFHTLFWPAMLKVAGYSLPAKVHIHGFLTVNGEKMSKSRGTFVRAATYLEQFDPSYLRYYYAAKLTGGVEDLDLSLDEFVAKVNADLVGNVVNLAARTARFAEKCGLAAEYPDDGGLFAQSAADGDAIAAAYDSGDYARAMRLVMAASDRANQYIDRAQPWYLAKDPQKGRELQDVCTIGLNLFRQLAIYLTPVLPRLARQTGELLGEPITHWNQSKQPLLGKPVKRFEHMMVRVKREQVDAMIEASKEADSAAAGGVTSSSTGVSPVDAASTGQPVGPALPATPPAPQDSDEPLRAEPLVETLISIDEFEKADLRIGRIVSAEDVPAAAKLLKMTVSLGGDVRRTVFAGIKTAYKPEALVGRLVVLAANLAPRKMKFGTSEGMILASGPGGKDIFLLSPDAGALPGQRIH